MERKLVREVQDNPNTSAEKIRVMWNFFSITNGISSKSLRRVLYKYGIRSRSAAKIIANVPKLRIIWWCSQRYKWSVADWKRIVFTNEVRFWLSFDGKVHNSVETKRQEIWSVLFGSEENRQAMDKVLSLRRSKNVDQLSRHNEVRRLCERSSRRTDNGRGHLTNNCPHQDNCPVHKAEIVNDWLRDNQVLAFDWPSYNTDFNFIENIWAIIRRRLSSFQMISTLWSFAELHLLSLA